MYGGSNTVAIMRITPVRDINS
ncbi:MAG: hypothetical protein MPEBLZ_04294, partial [Candidatus Methanoperedens nitroreducens]